MKIERITIKSFGMITDLVLDFSDDINVIIGKNESGKSTIAAFIKYMLYGFENETPEGETDERARYVNWENGTAQGSMHVAFGDKKYIITRLTEKIENEGRISYKEESSIIETETGSAVFGKIPAGEAMLGVDKSLFVNTAFINQIGDSSISESSVKQSIENILFSGSEKINNQRAASKVAVLAETLLHKGETGGAIYELVRRSEELRERFASADEDNKQILAKEAKLHDIRNRKAEAVSSLEEFTDLDDGYHNMLLIQSFDELHELEKQLDEKNEEYARYVEGGTVNGFSPTDAYLAEFVLSRRKVDDAYRALTDAEGAYEEEKRKVGITREMDAEISEADALGGEDAIEKKATLHKSGAIKFLSLGIVSLLCAIAALVFEIVATGAAGGLVPRIIVGILGGAALCGAGVLGFFVYREIGAIKELCRSFSTEHIHDLAEKISVLREERNKRDTLIRETEDARLAVERAKEKYSDAKKVLLDNILKWGEEPPTSNLNEFLNSLEDRIRAYLEEEKRILGEKQEIEITVKDLRKLLSDKNEIDIRGQVPPFKRKVLDNVSHETILTGIKESTLTIKALDALEEEVGTELTRLKACATDPGELYSKMQETDSRVEELRANHKACLAALSAIESASDNLRLEISPRLGEFSAALIGIMTDKKYTDIDVSDGLKLFFTAEDGERRAVDCLSGGTRDLTYVALRMALIDMLYSEKPPVCFDESFAHQDNARARSMMEAVAQLAEAGQQAFIFTCREREGILAREVAGKALVFKLTHGDEDLA